MTRMVRVIRRRFTVEDDGHGGSTDVTTWEETSEEACASSSGSFENDGRTVRWFESAARDAVTIIRRDGLGTLDGADWFGYPSPYTVDYSTGEEEETTAHLIGDWTDTERLAVARMVAWLERQDRIRAEEYAARR